MRSLPRIVKEPEKSQDIKPFDFFAGFKIHEEKPDEGQEEPPEEQEEPDDAEEAARLAAAMEEEILKKRRCGLTRF